MHDMLILYFKGGPDGGHFLLIVSTRIKYCYVTLQLAGKRLLKLHAIFKRLYIL